MKRRLPETLAPSELRAFLGAVTNRRDRTAVLLMLDAGLRCSEVVHLKLENISWEERLIRLVGKGSKEAEIPISARLFEALEDVLKERPAQANHEFLLFDRRTPSKPITRHAVYKMVRTVAKRASIKRRVHPHTFRHVFASRLYAETEDPWKVKAALRHEKLETSLIYTRISSDQLRDAFDSLDSRPWYLRIWSKLRSGYVPRFVGREERLVYIGETLGREKEISRLRKNYRLRIHTVVTGPRGVGKSHLLSHLGSEELVRVDSISPMRESLVKVCEQMKQKGMLTQVPKGRSNTVFFDAIREVAKANGLVLVIDTLDDITARETRQLARLIDCVTVFTSVQVRNRQKVEKLFFGNYDLIELEGFDRKTASEFTSRALGNANVGDEREYISYVFSETMGNPQAILELVDNTRRTGNLYPAHSGVQRVLSATPFLSAFMMILVVSRYSASALSKPELKVYFTVFLACIVPLFLLDRVLKQKNSA